MHPAILHDIPLLVEAPGARVGFDRIVVVKASDDERRSIADVIIDSGGTLAQTLEQADALWDRIRQDVGGSA